MRVPRLSSFWKVDHRRNVALAVKYFHLSGAVKQSPCEAQRAYNTRHYRPYKETSHGSKLVSSIVDPFARTSFYGTRCGARAPIVATDDDDDDDSPNERMRMLESKVAWGRLVNFTTPIDDEICANRLNARSDERERQREGERSRCRWDNQNRFSGFIDNTPLIRERKPQTIFLTFVLRIVIMYS